MFPSEAGVGDDLGASMLAQLRRFEMVNQTVSNFATKSTSKLNNFHGIAGLVNFKVDRQIDNLASLSDDDNPNGGGAAPVDVFEVFVVDVVAINDHISKTIVMFSSSRQEYTETSYIDLSQGTFETAPKNSTVL